MSQNVPPDQPESRDHGDFAQANSGQVAGYSYGEGNPYLTAQQPAGLPDLDAGAPQLRDVDSQRVNRKALVFLAGVVGILMLMILLVWRNTTGAKEEAKTPREETVVIPDLPQVEQAAAVPAEPIPLAQDARPLPPLPPTPAPPSAGEIRASEVPRQPSLVDRRIAAGGDGNAVQGATGDPYIQAMLAGLPGAQPAQIQKPAEPSTAAQFLANPDGLMVRGTYIRCVLETRIITDIPGFTSCVVTEPIYSINGRRLLLPKGSKMLGSYNMEPNGPRVAVIWDRITTPSGLDVTMASPGIDSLGGAGHPGHYSAHWPSRMAAALMISLVSDAFSYAAAEYGPETTALSNGIITEAPFESSTARTMERLANQALEKTANRPATVTINQGTVVNVYVARDVDFTGVLSR